MLKKHQKIMTLLDERIDSAKEQYGMCLHMNDGVSRTCEEMIHDLRDRGGQYAKLDQYEAQLKVLQELKREIQTELGL